MAKVIALIRTSTKSQEVDSQKQELINYIKADDINESDIIVVGQAGASAIKVDEAYKRNLEEVYRLIDEGNIKAVYAWAVDRIGRNEEILLAFKNKLVANKVQLIIKNPNLRLLEEDGTINSGIEIAFSLFATMAKQEMENKKVRFKRAKKRNALQGKYNGGRVHFGYCVNANGKIDVNDEEAKILRDLFTLYSSGEYSIATLTKELQDRGYRMRGKTISIHFVTNMLKSTAVIGYTTFNQIKRIYPRIISDSLFNKAQKRLKENFKGDITKQRKHINLSTKLIVCPTCGRHWFASNRAYQCIGHKYHGQNLQGYQTCENGESISIKWLDVAVWHVAKTCEMDYIYNFTETKAEEAKKQIEINNQKIKTFESKIAKIDERRKRIAIMFIEGEITKKEQEGEKERIKNDVAEYEKEIVSLKEQNEKLYNLTTMSEQGTLIRFGRLPVSGIYENVEEAFKITHRHIKSVVVENYEYKGKTQKLITITTMMDKLAKFVYMPKSKVKVNGTIYKLFKMDGDELKPLIATTDFVPSDCEFLN